MNNINMEKTEKKPPSKKILFGILGGVLLTGLIGGTAYWFSIQKRVAIEKAEISAPSIDLSASASGLLEEVFVKAGDQVRTDAVVARVGNELIKTRTSGLIINAKNDIGRIFNRGEEGVSMIDPDELRVVGHIEEDKGLKEILVGQRAIFSVDAFSSREYFGTVDEISEVSRQSGVVFNISDKREVKQFDVKIRFNINEYPELKNGMSAKIWIYK
jgi:multidrug resistance efflux pump